MRLSLALLMSVLATSVLSAQRGLDEVRIPSAQISLTPSSLRPGQQITVDVSFRQGLAFASIADLACSTVTSTSSTPCDATRALSVTMWRDNAAGIRADQPLGGGSIDFAPPAFYTLVTHSFTDLTVPQIEPNEFLTIELIFLDKTIKVDGHIGVTAVTIPRVLGFRRFKWACRAAKSGATAKCAYQEVTS